ncbi:MAG: DUF1385 domain-containing protein [Ruminococcaceae bacterium]|nr:DUF1385 domain-containing protein [Oscillospiraceae bacterium]MBR3597186.1 DUF1385 domain-containing protein [Clostridia bacterium]
MAKEKIIHKTSVGGQALMEGVMMNGPKGAAISVRHTDGHIITEMSEVKHIKDKVKILGLPFVRGIVNFIESMTVGYKSLMRSVELSGMLDEEEDKEQMSKLDRWLSEHLGPKVFNVLTIFASVIAVVFCVALFFYAPTYLVDLVDEKLLNGAIADFHPLFEGILKIVIVVIYMLVVSQMKDIKRVFMYHGAEHKSIFCYEKGLPLTVENVRKCKRFHPRCGTSFIFIVLITSVIVSFIVSFLFPELKESEYRIIWTIVKMVAILPVVTGISYELIKYAGRHDNIITKIFSAPGLWMQRITTKEPTDDMIEVAIASIKAVITDNPEDDRLE